MESINDHLQEVDFSVERGPCSYTGTYDYAQQLHFPANPNQPGPIYFKTPRNCTIFGICCEAIPRQVNFLIDEGVLTGKGANITISYVQYRSNVSYHFSSRFSRDAYRFSRDASHFSRESLQHLVWNILYMYYSQNVKNG